MSGSKPVSGMASHAVVLLLALAIVHLGLGLLWQPYRAIVGWPVAIPIVYAWDALREGENRQPHEDPFLRGLTFAEDVDRVASGVVVLESMVLLAGGLHLRTKRRRSTRRPIGPGGKV
jgi:hypothetical protein